MTRQAERVLALARDWAERGFTRLDALHEAGVFELAARINELERAGHRFTRSRERVRNRWDEATTVVRYRLEANDE